MLFSIHRPGGEKIYQASSPYDIDSLVNDYHEGLLIVQIDLGTPLEAFVGRGCDGRETVFLKSGALARRVERATSKEDGPDKLGVSCPSCGDFVPVDTINIPFRPHDDMLTDRGLVWVHGGSSAEASLFLHPTSIKEAGFLPSDIVGAALDAVRSQVFNRFIN